MSKRLWLAGALLPALGAVALAAGDVQVVVAGDTQTLFMTGAGDANNVLVTWDGVVGSFTVTGRDGTTINGLPAVQVTNVLNFDVDLGAGDDVLGFSGTAVRGNLVLKLGDGADSVTLDAVRVRGRTRVFGGLGSDRITASNHCVFKAFTARAQEGDDVIEVLDSAFLDRCRLDGGYGEDSILLRDDVFGRYARVEIRGGHDDDEVEIEDCAFKNDVFVWLEQGDDHLILDDNDFKLDAVFSGGGGDDDDLSLRSGNNFKFDHRPRFRSFEE
jgi:hypothetical protein